MSGDTLEQYNETLKLLDDSTIEKLYLIWISEKPSIATLRKLMIKNKILKEGIGKRQITQTANKFNIDRGTVYRVINSKKNKEEERK